MPCFSHFFYLLQVALPEDCPRDMGQGRYISLLFVRPFFQNFSIRQIRKINPSDVRIPDKKLSCPVFSQDTYTGRSGTGVNGFFLTDSGNFPGSAFFCIFQEAVLLILPVPDVSTHLIPSLEQKYLSSISMSRDSQIKGVFPSFSSCWRTLSGVTGWLLALHFSQRGTYSHIPSR